MTLDENLHVLTGSAPLRFTRSHDRLTSRQVTFDVRVVVRLRAPATWARRRHSHVFLDAKISETTTSVKQLRLTIVGPLVKPTGGGYAIAIPIIKMPAGEAIVM